LRSGADLAYIFCADEATVPIQCYSPELIVIGVYNAFDFDQLNNNNDKKKERLKQWKIW